MPIARISLISFRDGASDAEKDAVFAQLQRLTGLAESVAGALLARDLPPNRNGGDIIWRLEFASSDDLDALVASPEWIAGSADLQALAGFGSADTFAFEPMAVGERGEERPRGLYRLLVLALEEGTPDALRRQFEVEMAAMPDHISTILRWNFARVTRSEGANRWCYLWEQEYVDLTGFRGEYMMHPYHWGVVDRWYDSDNPARIVKPYLCNSFCSIDAPVMFTHWPRPAVTAFAQ